MNWIPADDDRKPPITDISEIRKFPRATPTIVILSEYEDYPNDYATGWWNGHQFLEAGDWEVYSIPNPSYWMLLEPPKEKK